MSHTIKDRSRTSGSAATPAAPGSISNLTCASLIQPSSSIHEFTFGQPRWCRTGFILSLVAFVCCAGCTEDTRYQGDGDPEEGVEEDGTPRTITASSSYARVPGDGPTVIVDANVTLPSDEVFALPDSGRADRPCALEREEDGEFVGYQRFGHDERGRLITIDYPLSLDDSPTGLESRQVLYYADDGRLLAQAHLDGLSGATFDHGTYHYDADGALVEIRTTRGHVELEAVVDGRWTATITEAGGQPRTETVEWDGETSTLVQVPSRERYASDDPDIAWNHRTSLTFASVVPIPDVAFYPEVRSLGPLETVEQFRVVEDDSEGGAQTVVAERHTYTRQDGLVREITSDRDKLRLAYDCSDITWWWER